MDVATGSPVRVISAPATTSVTPAAMALDGTDLFVANSLGNSVTELNAITGALVSFVSGRAYGFDNPSAIALDGPDIFVTNWSSNSVTQLSASTGALVRVISGTRYRFNSPSAILASGAHVFVANDLNGGDNPYPIRLREVNASPLAPLRKSSRLVLTALTTQWLCC